MFKSIKVLLCTVVILTACQAPVSESNYRSSKHLFVLGVDVSASTKGMYALKHSHLDSLYERISRKGGGTIYVVYIQSESRLQTPIRANVLPSPILLPLEGIPSTRERIRQENQKLQQNHLSNKKMFFEKMGEVIRRNSEASYTDIDGALVLMNTILKDRLFKDFQRDVLLITDGKQDLPQKNTTPVSKVALAATQIHLVRPQNEDLKVGLGTSCPVSIHATIDDAIYSL